MVKYNIFWMYVGRYEEFFSCAPPLCRCKTFTRGGAHCYYLLLLSSEHSKTDPHSTMGQRVRVRAQRVAHSYIYYIRAEYTCCNYALLYYVYCTCSASTTLTLKTGPYVFDDNSKVAVLLSPHTLRREDASV